MRQAHLLDNSSCEGDCIGRLAATRMDNDELIPAKPGHRVCLTHAAKQARRNALQQGVSHGVAQRVVDHFKAVQVQTEHSHLAAHPIRPRQLLVQPVPQKGSVAQAGQTIVMRHVRDACLCSLSLAQVAYCEHAVRPVGAPHLASANLDRYGTIICCEARGNRLPPGGCQEPRRTSKGALDHRGQEIRKGGVDHALKRLAEHLGQTTVRIADRPVGRENGDPLKGSAGERAHPGGLGTAECGSMARLERDCAHRHDQKGDSDARDERGQESLIEASGWHGHATIWPNLHGSHTGEVQRDHASGQKGHRTQASAQSCPKGQGHRPGAEQGPEEH